MADKPTAKAKIGEVFRKQLMRLKDYATAEDQSVRNQKPPEWYMPEDFDSSLFDIEAMHPPFSRREQEDQFKDAMKTAESPGTTADLVMISLQGDQMHVMERAFRARHMSSIRTRIQPAARLKGHGAETGVIKGGLLAYIEYLDKHNQGEKA